jgi:hypothetical protein
MTPDQVRDVLREKGLCGELLPGGQRVCIKPLDHGPHVEGESSSIAASSVVTVPIRITTATEATVFVLDRYERDNLIALLRLIYGQEGGPSCLATGDWAGQLYWKLAADGFDPAIHKPNVSPEQMLAMLLGWARERVPQRDAAVEQLDALVRSTHAELDKAGVPEAPRAEPRIAALAARVEQTSDALMLAAYIGGANDANEGLKCKRETFEAWKAREAHRLTEIAVEGEAQ